MSTRETISIGLNANDGTGDTLRSAGVKINSNLIKLWLWAGGDSDVISQYISFDSDEIVFEGTSNDQHETRLKAVNPTSDNLVLIPDASGTIIVTNGTQVLNNKTLNNSTLLSPKIDDDNNSHQYTIISGSLSNDVNLNLPSLTDSDTIVTLEVTQTLTNKTLTAPTISNPNLSGVLNDINGAGMLQFTEISSAVLNFNMANAATSGNPLFSVVGTDSNINMYISAKNKGAVRQNKSAYQLANIVAAGKIPENRTYINFNSPSPIAMTMADGTVNGEYKIFTNSNAGLITITPTNFAQGTSLALAQNEGCQIIWNGSNWFVVGNQSTLTIA
jgi:hypothetical protein